MAGKVPEYYNHPELASFKGCRRRYFGDIVYEMVDRRSTDSIVSWSPDGKSFIVWNPDKFATDILPKYGLGKFQSFIGRLTQLYNFRKVESEHCEFAHDYFVRGKPELTVEIEKQFRESCAPLKLDFIPPEPGYAERRRALIMAAKMAKSLSLKE